jgi:hypothetical protein
MSQSCIASLLKVLDYRALRGYVDMDIHRYLIYRQSLSFSMYVTNDLSFKLESMTWDIEGNVPSYKSQLFELDRIIRNSEIR